MEKQWNYIAILILVAGMWSQGHAQAVRAVASLESDSALIGDQQWLTLELKVPDGSKVSWPLFEDTLIHRVEILRRSAIDTVSRDEGFFTLRQQLLLTSFDSGRYVIPPIPFRYLQMKDTTNYYTETRSLTMVVSSPEVDQAGDIRPIKPPLRAPVTFAEIAPWLGGALGLTLALLGLWHYLKRKKAQQPVFQIRQKPKLPPYQLAMQSFEELRRKKLWQAGMIKDYYTELTDIVRIYIEGRFRVMAMEMTTYEIMEALSRRDLPNGSLEKLRASLTSADLVKFAKYKPLPDENDMHFNHCLDFVKATRPVEDLRQAEGAAEENHVEPTEKLS